MDISAAFKNKKVLITGAGRGIGRELVKTLHKGGAIVYALSQTEENLNSLKKECPSIHTIKCNLANWKETENVLKDIEPLDHLVNNAGVAIREGFFDITEETVDLTFNINIKAVMNVSRLISKKMVDAKKKGSIVNVSSLASFLNADGLMAYGVTKAAVDKVTKASAFALAPYKIRVNSVNPTIVLTDMGKDLWSHNLEECRKDIPLGQFAEVDHCINAILFLLSDLSAMTTGETLLIDGGRFGAT